MGLTRHHNIPFLMIRSNVAATFEIISHVHTFWSCSFKHQFLKLDLVALHYHFFAQDSKFYPVAALSLISSLSCYCMERLYTYGDIVSVC